MALPHRVHQVSHTHTHTHTHTHSFCRADTCSFFTPEHPGGAEGEGGEGSSHPLDPFFAVNEEGRRLHGRPKWEEGRVASWVSSFCVHAHACEAGQELVLLCKLGSLHCWQRDVAWPASKPSLPPPPTSSPLQPCWRRGAFRPTCWEHWGQGSPTSYTNQVLQAVSRLVELLLHSVASMCGGGGGRCLFL